MTHRIPLFATALGLAWSAAAGFAAEPIRIETVSRTTPVDFATEIAPLLQADCLACHNDKKPEGGLSLESIPAIVKGGDRGPAVVPGKGAASLLLIVAAHQDATVMPPPDNIVGARPMTPAQLGLLKLWIDQGAVGKHGVTREIHWQTPTSGYHPAFAAAVTPDGRYAVCSRGRQVCVYDLATGKPAAMLVDPDLAESSSSSPLAAAHHDVVRSLAFDPTGDLLASGGFREVKLWRRPRASRVDQWSHDAPIRSLAVSSDGRRVATGDEQGNVHVWEAAGGKKLLTIAAHAGPVTGLAFVATDGALVTCSLDKSLRRWTAGGKPEGQGVVLPDGIEAMVLIDDGRRLITGDRRGMALVWDVASLSRENGEPTKPTAEIKAHGVAVTSLAAVAEKPLEFFTGGADGLVRRWDVKAKGKLAEFKNDVPVAALAVDGSGHRVAAAGVDTLKIWDETGKSVTPPLGDPRAATKLAEIDSDIVFTKAVVGRSENDLKSYEGLIRTATVTMDAVKAAEAEHKKAEKARDEKKEALVKVKSANDKPDKAKVEAAEKGLAAAETAVAVALTVIERSKAVAERTAKKLADAQQALDTEKALLKKLEAARVETAAAAKSTGVKIRSLAFSPDHRRLAVGSDDGAVHLFDAESGASSQSLAEHAGAVRALAFSSQGMLFTGSTDRRTLVWSVPNEWRLQRIIGGLERPESLVDRVLSVDFSRDGKLLATGGGIPSRSGEVKIFNVADGRLVREIQGAHSDTVFAVRFSPTGDTLASAGGDRLIKIFDVNSGSELKQFAGHTGHVLGLAWNRDGKLLVSAGADNVLKLWNFETGSLVQTMKGGIFGNRTYKNAVTGVSFIGASEEIVAVSGDGTVRLQRASSDQEIMTFGGSKGYQHAAAATPDGKAVIAADADGTLRVWSGHQAQPRFSLTP